MPEYQKILYSVDQSIARITLNRPDKRNALDDGIVSEFKDALRAAGREESVRVVLVTGAGKDFCSGADLASLQRVSQAGVEESIASARVMAELFVEMRRHPRPIIAAVRGRALAGGCGLATACDIILAAESAQFGYPDRPADSAVWLPKERVLFSASGIVVDQFNILRPFVTIPDILAAAKMMKALNPEHVIPGHGQPGTVKIFEDTEKILCPTIGTRRQVGKGRQIAGRDQEGSKNA